MSKCSVCNKDECKCLQLDKLEYCGEIPFPIMLELSELRQRIIILEAKIKKLSNE